MTPESSAPDNSWYYTVGFKDGFWIRAVSCGPEIGVRLGWWEGLTRNGRGVWQLAEATECYVRFSTQ